MDFQLMFWIMTAVVSLLRLLIIGNIGLTGDEAHYWTYTTYPALSYFDHPPLVAWFIKPFTFIFGNNEFAVRLPAVLIFIVVTYLTFRLAKELYGDKAAFWATVLLNVMPVFSFLGAVVMIPDTPLSLFWMLFIYLFYRLIKDKKPYYWYLLGVVLGLALLSKYNAVFLPVSVLGYLLVSKEDRFHLKTKEPYLALLAALTVFLPVVIWNMQNGFASFGFQLAHGFGKSVPHFSTALLAKCLGAQAAYVSPVIFLFLWYTLVVCGINAFRKKDKTSLLIFAFSLPALLAFNVIASFNEILPHWPAMGYLILAPAAASLGLGLWRKKWFKALAAAGAFLGIALCVLIPLQSMFKVIPPEALLPKAEAMKIEDGITRAEKMDITNELYGWKEAGVKINEIIAGQQGEKPFIFTHRHYIASQLSFYIPGRPRVYTLSDRMDAYDLWQRDLSELDGKDAVFVTNDYFYVDPSKVFPFESWDKPVEVEIYRSGKKARLFWITVGRKFNLKALPAEYTSALAGSKMTVLQCARKIDHRLFWAVNRDCDIGIVNFFMRSFTKFDVTYKFNSALVIMIIAIALVLWFTKRATFVTDLVLFLGIMGFGGLIVHIMKNIFDRMRPLAVFGDQVRVFYELWERGSFPSGHSQIAFSVATYLALEYKKYWWLFYLGALCMGLSRIYVGVHFPADVFMGAVVGTVTAWAIFKIVKKDE